MVVTGFEIIGVLGTTAGLLGFIAGTVERLARVGKIVKNCSDRLQYHHECLENYADRMKAWDMRWEDRQLPTCWSEEGSQRIAVLKQRVVTEAEHIQHGLYHHDLEGGEIHSWRRFLDARGAIPEERRHHRLCRKVAQGLWREALLEDDMKRLSTAIGNLESAARVEFYRYNGAELSTKDPTTQELEQADLLVERAERLWRTMDDAYGLLVNSHSPIRSLLFTRASQDGLSSILSSEEEDELELRFLIPKAGISPSAHEATVSVSLDRNIDSTQLAEVLQLKCLALLDLDEPCLVLQQPLAGVLREVYALPVANWQRFMKASRVHRAEAALGIATWASMIPDCRWMIGLCACNFRGAQFTYGDQALVFTKYRFAEESCHCRQAPDQLFALGVVMAALALGQLVTLRGEHPFPFRLLDASGHVNIDAGQLCELVRQETSRPYGSAVQYCLSQRPRMFRDTVSRGGESRRAMERIVQPLYQHWKILQKRQQRLPKTYRQFAADAPAEKEEWYR